MGNALSPGLRLGVALNAYTARQKYLRVGSQFGGVVLVRGAPETVNNAHITASLQTTAHHSWPETAQTWLGIRPVVRTETTTVASVPITLTPPLDTREVRPGTGEIVVGYVFTGVVPNSTKTSFGWKDGKYSGNLKTEIFVSAQPEKPYHSAVGVDHSKPLPPIWPAKETRERSLVTASQVNGRTENRFLLSGDLDDIAVSVDASVVSRGGTLSGVVRIAHRNAAGELRDEPSDVKRIDIAVDQSHSVRGFNETYSTLAFKSIHLDQSSKMPVPVPVPVPVVERAESDNDFYSPRAKKRRHISRAQQRELAQKKKRLESHTNTRSPPPTMTPTTAPTPTVATAPTTAASPTETKPKSPNHQDHHATIQIPFTLNIPVCSSHHAGSDYSIPPFSSNTMVDISVVYTSLVKMNAKVHVPIRLVSPLDPL